MMGSNMGKPEFVCSVTGKKCRCGETARASCANRKNAEFEEMVAAMRQIIQEAAMRRTEES